jgi:hypothetical protein
MRMVHRFNLIEREDAQSKRVLADSDGTPAGSGPSFLLFASSLMRLWPRLWSVQGQATHDEWDCSHGVDHSL